MPVSAETQIQLTSNEKILPIYIVNFYGNTEQKIYLYRKKILTVSFCKKIAQCRLKNISRGFTMTDVGNCDVNLSRSGSFDTGYGGFG